MVGADVVVIGAGIVGFAVANALAQRGASVVVLERDHPGAQTSRTAAGMLTPFVGGLAEGPLLSLGARALEEMAALAEEVQEHSGVDPGLVRSGCLRIASKLEEALLRNQAKELEPYDVRWVDRDELLEREPGVTADAVGGLWSPREAYVRPRQLTRALEGAALSRGVRLERGVPVLSLRREGNRIRGAQTPEGDYDADQIVICAGAWSGLFEESLGFSVPVEPIRGQILELGRPPRAGSPILWGLGAYLVPRQDGTFLVGATEERVGFETRVTASGVQGLLEAACEILPEVRKYEFREARVALRPGTPDDRPLVGRVPNVDGAWLATGHYRHGVLLAGLTGKLIAQALVGGESPDELQLLDPGRFVSSS
jgi:glycine oxidase